MLRSPPSWLVFLLVTSWPTGTVQSFVLSAPTPKSSSPRRRSTSSSSSWAGSSSHLLASSRRARDLMQSLLQDEQCFSTEQGARAFANACAFNVVYEDRFHPQPFVGTMQVTEYLLHKVTERKGRGTVRLDKISDGDQACGYAWTWISGNNEGLRGTSFVELNGAGQIQYVSEIPEPIYKPGNLTLELLKAVTAGAERKAPVPWERKSPTKANEIAKHLFIDLQNADPKERLDELTQFLDESVVYRDFNFEDVLRGPAEVRQIVEDFSFPGIEFNPLRFDDGLDSTCFTWEVVLNGEEDTIKGLSFYELDPVSRKIVYVRDVAESAIKPPILGKLARQLRPGLGVFQGVRIGSRPGGM